ncbi:MAG: hypothetical protein RLZZ458_2523, partial [Planctomycetota bacterium]
MAVAVQVATLLGKVLRKRRPVTTAGVYSESLVSGCEEEWIGNEKVGLISTSDRTWHLKGLKGSQRHSEFARSLASVNPGQLMERLQEAEEFGAALDPLLRSQVQRADEVDATAAERRAALASRLVPRDQNQVPVLSEVLLSGELPYVAAIRERLRLGLRRGELPVDEPLFECSVVPLYEPRFSSGPESVREP